MAKNRRNFKDQQYPVTYRIRMTNRQWDLLSTQAEEKGINVSDSIRSLLMTALYNDILDEMEGKK